MKKKIDAQERERNTQKKKEKVRKLLCYCARRIFGQLALIIAIVYKHWTWCVCLCNRPVRIALERALLQKFLLYSKHVHDLKNRERIKTSQQKCMQRKAKYALDKIKCINCNSKPKKISCTLFTSKKNCTFECCDFCQFFVIFLAFLFSSSFYAEFEFLFAEFEEDGHHSNVNR